MRTIARSICVVVLALIVWVPISPAVAKGPTDVAVEGPGVDRQLTYTRRAGDVDIGTLGDAARIYQLWYGRGRAAPPLTPDELGPEFVLTWTVAGMSWATQYAYPFAEGGAWVRHRTSEGKEGWARTPGLTDALVELGAVAEHPKPTLAQPVPSDSPTDVPASSSAPDEDEDDSWSTYRVVVPAGVLLAGVLMAGVLIARRRRLDG